MISLLQRWYQRHFSQPGTIEFALVLLGAFLIVYYLMWLVGPIVVALCLAFCLDWPTESLCTRFRIGRHLASILVMILFCSAVISVTVLIVPNVIKQGAEFYNSIVAFSLESPNHVKQTSTPDQAGLEPAAPAQAVPQASNQSANPSASGINHGMPHVVPAAAAPMAAAAKAAAQRNTAATTVNPPSSTPNATASAVNDNAPSIMAANGSEPSTLAATGMEQSALNGMEQSAPASAPAPESTHPQITPLEADRAVFEPQIGLQSAHVDTQKRIAQVATTGPRFMPNLEVNREPSEFTLTVRDFDLRIARELNDIVIKLPEPLPSMVTLDMLERTVSNLRQGATKQIATLMSTQLMPSVVNAFTWLVYLIVVPIFTFLMLYNKHELQNTARLFLLPNNQQLMRKFWPSMHQQIAGYIRGKLLHIIIISIANTLAFMALGVNYALLLGVGVGLSVVIPYVGAVIIAVPVVLVAIFQFGFSTELMWVLIIYTVIQLLDSNILTPMLFAKAMSLDAFSILAAIMIFGGLWGFWGVFFAIPLATFIKTLITRWPNADTQQPSAAADHTIPAAAAPAPSAPQAEPAPKTPPKKRI